jgi:hypothetical protein
MEKLEEQIFLLHSEENPSVEACKYLALLDKNELNQDDLSWEDIEPYTRILGVRTQDVYQNQPFVKQDIHKIEGKIIERYEKICKIVKNSDPVRKTTEICREFQNVEKKIKDVQEKQQKCYEKSLEFLSQIQKKINELGMENRDETGPFAEMALKLKYIQLKAKFLRNSINSEVYNERSSKALRIIRDELEGTYEEYNDVRRLLNERICMYENNDSIQDLLKRYSIVKQRIFKKRQDILSISK